MELILTSPPTINVEFIETSLNVTTFELNSVFPSTVNPEFIETLPSTTSALSIETSFTACNLLLTLTSPTTYNLELRLTSLPTNNVEFIETSLWKVVLPDWSIVNLLLSPSVLITRDVSSSARVVILGSLSSSAEPSLSVPTLDVVSSIPSPPDITKSLATILPITVNTSLKLVSSEPITVLFKIVRLLVEMFFASIEFTFSDEFTETSPIKFVVVSKTAFPLTVNPEFIETSPPTINPVSIETSPITLSFELKLTSPPTINPVSIETSPTTLRFELK